MVSLQAVSSSDIECLCLELGKETVFRRAFPMISYAAFQRSVVAAYKIQDRGGVRGVLFEIRPMNEFTTYGEHETLLLIYPEFQRQGIATEVMRMLCEAEDKRFFVSAKANSASTAFFQKQSCLKLVAETERYRVFGPLGALGGQTVIFNSRSADATEVSKQQPAETREACLG